MTRSSPILYWVLGLLGLCAVLGFYNGFRTATRRDTPSWAGGSTLSANPDQAAVPGVEPPEAKPLAPDNPAGIAPVQTAPAEKAKPKDDDDDQPEADTTTATAIGEPKPAAPPPAASDKPAADRTTAEKPKAPAAATPARPRPAPTPAAPPPAEAPPPAQQPSVPY
jgi:cytoskeletal protein RodZ